MIPESILQKIKTKKVLIELPEGLKTKAVDIARFLKQKGFDPIISGDLCFGACDVHELENATTLHIGHTKLIDSNAVYWEYPLDVGLIPACKVVLEKLPEKIGLITTAQHLHELDKAKEFLEANNKKVFVEEGETFKQGQVLGCNKAVPMKIKDKVDAFLFIGTGQFHAMGTAYYTKKDVIVVDPFSLDVRTVKSDDLEKESALRKTKAMHAKIFGIVVSRKPGQKNWGLANSLAKKINNVIIYMDNITPDALLPFKVDAFVITACPRIVIDDWKNYSKAVLLPEEALSLTNN